jgi:ComF family protein
MARVQRALRGALSLVGRETLRIVLPSWCVACEKELPWAERKASCCAQCWAEMPRIDGAKCRSCALPLPVEGIGRRASGVRAASPEEPGVEAASSVEDSALLNLSPMQQLPDARNLAPDAPSLCLSCTRTPLPLDWCDAWGLYAGPLERVLHALKFQRHDFLDDALAALLEETLRVRGDLAFDAVAAVPMTRSRERKRGYNQAELLARALARRVGIRCDMTLLARRGEGAVQSTLPKRDRAANVRGAFAASSRVKGRSILLVDDICTTGETLRACADALLGSGASRVCAVTVAKAS